MWESFCQDLGQLVEARAALPLALRRRRADEQGGAGRAATRRRAAPRRDPRERASSTTTARRLPEVLLAGISREMAETARSRDADGASPMPEPSSPKSVDEIRYAVAAAGRRPHATAPSRRRSRRLRRWASRAAAGRRLAPGASCGGPAAARGDPASARELRELDAYLQGHLQVDPARFHDLLAATPRSSSGCATRDAGFDRVLALTSQEAHDAAHRAPAVSAGRARAPRRRGGTPTCRGCRPTWRGSSATCRPAQAHRGHRVPAPPARSRSLCEARGDDADPRPVRRGCPPSPGRSTSRRPAWWTRRSAASACSTTSSSSPSSSRSSAAAGAAPKRARCGSWCASSAASTRSASRLPPQVREVPRRRRVLLGASAALGAARRRRAAHPLRAAAPPGVPVRPRPASGHQRRRLPPPARWAETPRTVRTSSSSATASSSSPA